MSQQVFSLAELPSIASRCVELWKGYRVFAFHGEMGAGKTTFIRALCREWGVKDNVSSPTFSIINEYTSPFGSLYHMDLYRLRSEEEAINAGVEETLYTGNICLVEWPENAPGLLPENTLHIYLSTGPDNKRVLETVLPA